MAENEQWHALSVEEVLEKTATDSRQGLSAGEAEKRLEQDGRNEMPKARQRSAWQRLLDQFNNWLIYILLIAAGITALIQEWIDALVILAVVIINALIGFIQEGRAEKALASLGRMLSLEANVLRDGEKRTIDARELVRGDLVRMQPGDKVPADVRIIDCKNFQVDESPLTGESVAVTKETRAVDQDAVTGDQLSMAFSGTMVTSGGATGVVVRTGEATEIGQINKMMSEVEKITTPLLQKIEKFSKSLSLVILTVAAFFFAFGYFLRDYELFEMFLVVIGLVVAAIPEGLPAIITIALAVAVRRMAARHAIVRRLPSVETLGAVNIIFSDKTGTLTRNEMTAKSIATASGQYEVQGSGYEPKGSIHRDDKEVDPKEDKVLWRLLQAARSSNNAEIHEEEGGWKLSGMPTEGALLALAYKGGLEDYGAERLDSIPFESDHQYMATLNTTDEGTFIFVTGAPEKLLDISKKQIAGDGPKDLDRDYWDRKIEEMAAQGQRVLAAAFREVDGSLKKLEMDDVEQGSVFLGLVGIIDPPRQEVIEAVKECAEAGIRAKMITGDHVITARSIGKQIGIGDGEKALSGKEIEKMSDEELRGVINVYDVFARSSPEHKLRLVNASQENGLLVAMTGDGVNDAPALKKANIGIAMGIKGTEVSRDAAEMVLADDNFASIVNAVEEGRTVYDNIRKALLFVLPTNGAESLVLMVAIFLNMVMPITPVQILWVNMVTAVTLAMSVAFEPMEEDVMKRPPRKTDEPLLDGMFVWRIIFVSFLVGGITFFMFEYFKGQGMDLSAARTLAVNTLVAGQMFYLLNCRKIKSPVLSKGFFSNKTVFYAIGALILFQMLFVYAPFMNAAFNTYPLEAGLWLYPLGAGIVVFFVVEGEKWIAGRFESKDLGSEHR